MRQKSSQTTPTSPHERNTTTNTTQWLPYDSDREAKVTEGGVVLRPKDSLKNITPVFCPTCHLPMKGKEDFLSYHRTLKACEHCEREWWSVFNEQSDDDVSKELVTLTDEYLERKKKAMQPVFEFV